MILNHGTRDFFINVFFFYFIPIILLVKIINFARSRGVLKQLTPPSSKDVEQGPAEVENAPTPTKQTPNARRIVPKKTPNMRAAPKLKAKS